jgi:parallel beta-helix repeat protein
VQIRGDYNYVAENIIAGNTEDGVLFFDGTGTDLVPDGFPSNNIIERNRIFLNGYSGIGVYVGDKNHFAGNAIFSNLHLGINLETRTFGLVTMNDSNDLDEGTNGLQNFPVITSALTQATQTIVAGTLTTRPNGVYQVELYANFNCNSLGHGEGLVPLLLHPVTTNAAGVASFSVAIPHPLPRGMWISATATSPNKSTSEFSQCRVVE